MSDEDSCSFCSAGTCDLTEFAETGNSLIKRFALLKVVRGTFEAGRQIEVKIEEKIEREFEVEKS
jgi:hypothetical protein